MLKSTIIADRTNYKYEQEYFPQLSSFDCGPGIHEYLGKLIGANPPVVDFRHVRSLDVAVGQESDLAVAHALLKATDKLETLVYWGVSHN